MAEAAEPDPAVERYVLLAKLALLNASAFFVATSGYLALRMIGDVPYTRAGAGALLLPGVVALVFKCLHVGRLRTCSMLAVTTCAAVPLFEGLVWILLRGGQGTLLTGVTALLVCFLLINFVDARIIRR